MVGRASPRSLPIRLLTSPHDAIISNRWRSPQANFNTRCDGTTAVGSVVLQDNIEGIDNTGVGNIALWHNQGDGNTALGSSSLSANTTGNFNTGVGTSTLPASTKGSNNLAAGYSSLYRNTR